VLPTKSNRVSPVKKKVIELAVTASKLILYTRGGGGARALLRHRRRGWLRLNVS
jgi:hypothetical protein